MNDSQRSGVSAEAHDEIVAKRFVSMLRGILCVALALRIVVMVYTERDPARFDYPDSHRYVQVARHTAAGQGPIDSPTVRAGTDPLYPAILSVGIYLGLDDTTAILRFGRIINTLCALCSIALLAMIGRHFISVRAGLAAAAILAIDPILLFFNGLVLTETLYITLLLASVYGLTRFGHLPRARWALVAGLALGLGTLTRSTNLLLPVAFLPFVVLFSHGHRSTQRRAVMMFILGVVVCLVPPVMRNYRMLGHLVPVRTGGGASLLEAFGPWADGGPGMDRIEYPPVPADADEYARDQSHREAAIDWIRKHPGQVIRLARAKLARTWSVTINAPGYSSPVYQGIGWLTVAPIYLLAAVGIYLLRKRPVVVWLCLTPALYFSCIHMVFVGSVRYRLPAMPLLFLLAGAAIDRGWRAASRPAAARG